MHTVSTKTNVDLVPTSAPLLGVTSYVVVPALNVASSYVHQGYDLTSPSAFLVSIEIDSAKTLETFSSVPVLTTDFKSPYTGTISGSPKDIFRIKVKMYTRDNYGGNMKIAGFFLLQS